VTSISVKVMAGINFSMKEQRLLRVYEKTMDDVEYFCLCSLPL